jgi:hypothetical protein
MRTIDLKGVVMSKMPFEFCLEHLKEFPLFLYIDRAKRPDLEGKSFEIILEVEWIIDVERFPRVCFKMDRGSRPGEIRLKLGEYEAVVLRSLRLVGFPLEYPLPKEGEKYGIPVYVKSVSSDRRPGQANMYEVELALDGKRTQSTTQRCSHSVGIDLGLDPAGSN